MPASSPKTRVNSATAFAGGVLVAILEAMAVMTGSIRLGACGTPQLPAPLVVVRLYAGLSRRMPIPCESAARPFRLHLTRWTVTPIFSDGLDARLGSAAGAGPASHHPR